MRIALLFFAYLLACFTCAALLAVPLNSWFELEPHRLMGRLAQLFILLGAWPFLRCLQIAQRSAIGYGVPGSEFRRSLGLGWLIGVAILSALLIVLMVLEVRVPDPAPPTWLTVFGKLMHGIVGGFLVSFLEETIFRGALHTAMRRTSSLASTLCWSGLLYSAVHFIDPNPLPEGQTDDLVGALWTVFYALGHMFQWEHIDSFVALFFVGVFLGLVRERTGHIGWCIGVHAGWVTVIMVGRKVTDYNEDGSLAFLVGNYDGTIGWLAALWIAVLSVAYWMLTQPKTKRVSEHSESPVSS